MKITTEQYNVLKLMAEDIVSQRDWDHPLPEEFERNMDIVVRKAGKREMVEKLMVESTKSAILIAMVKAVEEGKNPLSVMDPSPKKKPVAVEDQSQEHDVFTEEALKKIPPGKPDAATLAPPVSLKPGDKVISKGKTMVVTDEFPRTEGHEWQDEKGRYWKIIDGKKRQQKKPKNADQTGK